MNRGEVEELVQNTVRKLNTGPEACLTNPRVLSFFNIMKDSFHRCIKTLASSAVSPEEKAAAYQHVVTWSPDRISEEVELIMKRYPTVKDSYTYAAVYIVEQTYKKENGQLKLKLPSFQSFVHTFYSAMVSSEPLQHGTYDSLQFFEKEMLTCQCFCNALYTSIKTEPVVKAQSVVIEPSTISKRQDEQKLAAGAAHVSQKPAALSKASQKQQPPPQQPPQQVSQIASASRFSAIRGLSPQDSVSQFQGREREASSFRGMLTEEFLNKHRSSHGQEKRGSEASQVSKAAEAAASIRKASAKKATSEKPSVRVVDIVDHPQKHLTKEEDTDSSDSSSSDSSDKSFALQQYDRDHRNTSTSFHVTREGSHHKSKSTSRDRDHSRDHDFERDRDHSRDHDHSRDRDFERDRDRDREHSRDHSRDHDRDRDRPLSRLETGRSRQNPNRRH